MTALVGVMMRGKLVRIDGVFFYVKSDEVIFTDCPICEDKSMACSVVGRYAHTHSLYLLFVIILDLSVVLNFAIDGVSIDSLVDFGERFREKSVSQLL